jgi:hypothetical protein
MSKGRREGFRSLRLGGVLLAALGSSIGGLPAAASSFAVAAAVVSVSSSASAQEGAEVEAILKRGIQLRRDGQDEAALAVFQEAEALAPNSVRVLLHVATAAQAASKWLLADEYLKKADSHSNDPYYVRYRAEIDEVRSTTSQRVGHFRAVGEPSGAEVILNGQVVGTLPMENPKTLEAGTYVLEVNKPGFYRLRRPIAVPGGVLTRETVELNERTGTGPDPTDGSGSSVPAEPPSFWASSGMTWTLAGVAAAAGVTSGVSFFLRERAADHWNDDSRCLSSSPADQNARREELCSSVRNDIDTAEQVGIVSGVVGIAFAGAALTHWIATSSSEPGVDSAARRESKSAGTVQCSPGLMTLVCNGTF